MDTEQRLAQWLDVTAEHGRPFVLMHTNPDPDALASALGIQTILQDRVGGGVPIAMGGMIGRAENRALVENLRLTLTPVAEINPAKTPSAVLVDSQPETGNVPELSEGAAIVAVFDHHPMRQATRNVAFHDVRTEYGSTSTIVWEYLLAGKLAVSKRLATALFYGIKSDTHDLWRQVTPADEQAYIWLFTRLDRKLLARIENPTVPKSYFRHLQRALNKARVYDHVLVTDLERAEHPELVAEVADWFLVTEGINWTMASGWSDGGLVFSIRARERTAKHDAGELAQALAHVLGGTAGGHGTMAAGRIEVKRSASEATTKKLQRSLLALLNVAGRGRSLV